jgi:hypothetical protein
MLAHRMRGLTTAGVQKITHVTRAGSVEQVWK